MPSVNILRIILVIAALIIKNSAFCKSWTLEECIEHALSNNLTILSDAIESNNIVLEKKSMKLNYIPIVSLSNNFSSSTGRTLDETTYQYSNKSLFYNSSNISISLSLNSVIKNVFDLKKHNITQKIADRNSIAKRVALRQEISATYFEMLYMNPL